MAETTARKTTRKATTAAKTTADTTAETTDSGFDFTALTPETVPAPVRQGGGRTRKDNPFDKWLQESMESKTVTGTRNGTETWVGEGRRIAVPSHDAAKEASNLIRYAANALNVGASVELTDANGNRIVKVGDLVTGKAEKVTITFAAKSRRQRHDNDNGSDSDSNATNAETTN
jgi:hypothetical protein